MGSSRRTFIKQASGFTTACVTGLDLNSTAKTYSAFRQPWAQPTAVWLDGMTARCAGPSWHSSRTILVITTSLSGSTTSSASTPMRLA